ncbi:MAG: MBL fold metallo-hydrolase [Rhizobiaceae bacterium]
MAKRTRGANPYYSGQRTDHFDGEVFYNPEGRGPGSLRELLRWKVLGRRVAWPKRWPSPFPAALPARRVDGDRLRVTMVGHSTLLVQTSGLNLLTDPVWSERASPFAFAGPRRVNPPGIAFEDLPPIDVVLLSHNHYDHMDLGTMARLKRTHDPLVVTPHGNDAILRRAAPDMRMAVGDWGDSFDIPGGSVRLDPAHHWSARGGRDRRMALWCAFALETEAGRVYYAGDTGFDGGRHYRNSAGRGGPFRLAILPIGAYEPRWFMEPHHQNPAEAVEGMRLLGAAYAAGCHWGTFRLTDEGVDDPRSMLEGALRTAGIASDRFRPMLPGEVWDVPDGTA